MSRTYYNVANKLWSGPEISANFHPNLTLGHALLLMLDRHPDAIAQISDNNNIRLTNKEIKRMSIRVAQHLMNQVGVHQNDVIGIVAKNSHQLAPIVFGSFLIGTPINILDPMYSKAKICHMFGITKPKLVFCDHDNYEMVKSALESLNLEVQIFIFGIEKANVRHVDELLKETGTEDNFVAPHIDDVDNKTAVILCSSGTTEQAKGVCISHTTMLHKCVLLETSEDDVTLCLSSLNSFAGIINLIIASFHNVTRIITTDPYSPELILGLIAKYKVTHLFTPSSIMALMVKSPAIETSDLSSIKAYICAGFLLSDEIKQEMKKFLPNGIIGVAYGMNETAGTVAVDLSGSKCHCVGHLGPGFFVKIINDDGEKLGIGEIGEVYVKSIFKFLGYYKNEEATNEFVDQDGWIHTGDIGYFDKEGDLYIVDRKKDVLIYGGHHIAPSDLETLIHEDARVAQVCVVGIPSGGDNHDLPAAVVVKSPGSDLSEIDVINLVKDHRPNHDQLRGGVFFVDSIPTSIAGKIKRKAVQEIAIEFYRKKGPAP